MRRIVVCCIEDDVRKILLLHRTPDRKHEPNVWYLMAATMEEGEHPEQTLKRELGEELAIKNYEIIQRGKPYVGTNVADVYPFKIRTSDKIIVDRREHDDWKWVHPSEINNYKHPDYLKTDLASIGIIID